MVPLRTRTSVQSRHSGGKRTYGVAEGNYTRDNAWAMKHPLHDFMPNWSRFAVTSIPGFPLFPAKRKRIASPSPAVPPCAA